MTTVNPTTGTNPPPTPSPIIIEADKNRDGTVSRHEAETAITAASENALKVRQSVDWPSVAIALQPGGRIYVGAPDGVAPGSEVLHVRKGDKAVHHNTTMVQGALNQGMQFGGPLPSGVARGDARGAATQVFVDQMRYSTPFPGASAVPGSLSTSMSHPLLTPARITAGHSNMPVVPGPRTMDNLFRAFGDSEALTYLKALDKKPNAAALREHLNRMLHIPFEAARPHEISSYQLVKSALHDIVEPVNISQETVGSCAAAGEQIRLAHEDPGTYLRMLTELARDGETRMPAGQTLKANFTYFEPGSRDEDRSLSSGIIQNSFMAFAKKDPAYHSGDKKSDGLMPAEKTTLIEALSPGENVIIFEKGDRPPEKGRLARMVSELLGLGQSGPQTETAPLQEIMPLLKDALAAGHLVSAKLKTGQLDAAPPGYHAILVTGMQNGEVTIVNPWGRLERMPVADFEKRLENFHLPNHSN